MTSPRVTHHTLEDLLPGHYTDGESTDLLENSKQKQYVVALPRVEEEPKLKFKYAHVWRRAMNRIRLQRQLKEVQSDLQLFGGNVVPIRVTSKGEVEYREARKRSDTHRKVWFDPWPPNSRFKRIWSVLYSLIMAYAGVITPFAISFIKNESAFPWLELNILVDVLFFFDILLNFNTAYEDSDQKLVTERWKIAKKYARFWLPVDLAACLPLYLLPEQYHFAETLDGYRMSRLIRLLRLLHLSRLYLLFSKSRGHHINDLLHMRTSSFRLISFFLSITLTTHIVACMWHLLAVLDSAPDNWIVRGKLVDAGNADRYIAALHWTVQTLSTVGYGDIIPATEAERVFACCWMLFALFFISYAIGCLSEVFDPRNSKENTMIRKLAVIDEFADEANLDPELKSQLRIAISNSVEKSDLLHSHVQDVFQKDIPIDLRYEVAQVIHRKSLKDISFFHDKEKHFVVMVFPFLGSQFVQEGLSVYCENDAAELIYFISGGRCAVIAQEQFVVKKLWLGSYFGDIEVFMDVRRLYTVKAASASDLLTMDRRLLRDIRKRFSAVYDEMETVAFAKERAWNAAKATVSGLREKYELDKRTSVFGREGVLKKKMKENVRRLSSASRSSCQVSSQHSVTQEQGELEVLAAKASNTLTLLTNLALLMQRQGFPISTDSLDDSASDASLHDAYSPESSSGREDTG